MHRQALRQVADVLGMGLWEQMRGEREVGLAQRQMLWGLRWEMRVQE